MTPLFEGVRVLDLTRLLPGPFATMIFADGGADVIKVEDTKGGDYARYYPPIVGDMSTFFASVNRNKRSIALDLKADADHRVFAELVKQSDVVIESFRPGVMASLGISYDQLRNLNPPIILCSISGYGQSGPSSRKAGHDLNFVAKSGLLSVAGRRGTIPAPPPFQLADLAGGALYAVSGVAAALFQRERTGEGRWLDISMTEGAMTFAIPLIAQHDHKPVEREGELLNGGVPSYDVYETRDGRWLGAAPLEPKFWAQFVEAIDRPELANDSFDGSEKVRLVVADAISERTLAQWQSVFEQYDACTEPVLTFDELPSDPTHVAREVFFELAGVRQMWTPLSSRAEPTPAPSADQHGDEIRAWLKRASE